MLPYQKLWNTSGINLMLNPIFLLFHQNPTEYRNRKKTHLTKTALLSYKCISVNASIVCDINRCSSVMFYNLEKCENGRGHHKLLSGEKNQNNVPLLIERSARKIFQDFLAIS